MAENLEDLKKQVFYDMLNIAGRVYIAIRCGDDVVIGRRGFLPEEKEKGLVLVFNKKMNFSWDDDGISITLVFGTSPEKCFIPKESITTIFSPELNATFSVVLNEEDKTAGAVIRSAAKTKPQGKKVIKVDFNRGKN